MSLAEEMKSIADKVKRDNNKVYVFKKLKNDEVGDMLMFDENTKASFDTVADALKYLIEHGIDKDKAINDMIYSDETGFLRYPCTMYTYWRNNKY